MAFLPARMTRILVGGHVSRLEDVIATLHAEGVVHIEDYEDPTGTTAIGTPLPRGDQVSALLVRLRGLQKQLGAEGMPPGNAHADAQALGAAEAACGPLLERLARLRAEMGANESAQQALRPLDGLDFDTAAASGHRSIKVYVGTARRDPAPSLRSAGVQDFGTAPANGAWAVAVAVPLKETGAAERALAEAGFAAVPVPAGKGTPAERLAALAIERSRLAAEVAAAEAAVAQQRANWGTQLATLEAHLSTEAEKTQAPLRFGVTQATFHIEGWVPRPHAARLQATLASKFGDKLYVHELGDAPSHGHGHPDSRGGGNAGGHAGGHGPANGHGHAGGAHAAVTAPAAMAGASAASHAELHAKGVPHSHGPQDLAGHAAGHGDGHGDGHDDGHDAHADPAAQPPVQLQNPAMARPYEWILGLLARPKYNEVDPSKLMLLFFPLFFGLMVGDMAVGVAIVLFGLYLKTHNVIGIGGPAVGRALMAGGIVSVLVGAFVFGEALGIHLVVDDHAAAEGEMSWEQIARLHIPYESESHGLFYKSGAPSALHDSVAIPGDGHPGTPDPTTDASHAPTGPASTSPSGTAAATTASAGSVAPASSTLRTAAEGVEEKHGLFAPHSPVHLYMGPVPLGLYSKIHDVQPLLIWSLVIGVVHIVLGLVIGIRNVAVNHGVALAIQEKAGWLGLMAGVALAIVAIVLGALPMVVGYVGIGLVVTSLALLWMGAAKVLGQGFIAILEIPTLIGNIVSYTRLAAIGVSKAGLVIALGAVAFTIMGGGWAGWLVYLIGFIGIVLLAILSAGLQALRLQFVEFFGKFFEGGGRAYVPFGRRAA